MPTSQFEPSRATSWGRTTALHEFGEGIRHLSPAAQAAFARFQGDHDPAALDPIIIGIIGHFAPEASAPTPAGLPGATRLIEDLGFDSLTMVEFVFFTEELFGVSVTNAEIVQVRTVDDLRAFLRHKLADRAAAGPPSPPPTHG